MWQETTNRPTKLCVTRVTAGINTMMWQSTTTITPHELDATVREEVEGNTGAGIKRYAHPYLYFLTPFQHERGASEGQKPLCLFRRVSTRTGQVPKVRRIFSFFFCFC